MTAMRKKGTEDAAKRSVEDMQVVAAVIVTTTDDIRLPASGTHHFVTLGDGNQYTWIAYMATFSHDAYMFNT